MVFSGECNGVQCKSIMVFSVFNATPFKNEGETEEYDFLYQLYDVLWLYGVPILSVVAIFNNMIILLVAFCFDEFKKAVNMNIRVYYIIFALADLILLFAYHVLQWFSMQFYIIHA